MQQSTQHACFVRQSTQQLKRVEEEAGGTRRQQVLAPHQGVVQVEEDRLELLPPHVARSGERPPPEPRMPAAERPSRRLSRGARCPTLQRGSGTRGTPRLVHKVAGRWAAANGGSSGGGGAGRRQCLCTHRCGRVLQCQAKARQSTLRGPNERASVNLQLSWLLGESAACPCTAARCWYAQKCVERRRSVDAHAAASCLEVALRARNRCLQAASQQQLAVGGCHQHLRY